MIYLIIIKVKAILRGIVRFGVEKLSWRVDRTARRFLTLKSEKYNVNLPGYTLTPTTPIPSYRQQTSNKSPKITTLQADYSHFSAMILKRYQWSHFKPKISLKSHDNHTNISKQPSQKRLWALKRIAFIMYHCLSVWRSIFMILSSSGISLNRHQCAVSVYVLHGVYNLSCRNVYSRISDILHRSFSSLYCFQSVLSSYPHTFIFFYVSGCSCSNQLHPFFVCDHVYANACLNLFVPSVSTSVLP